MSTKLRRFARDIQDSLGGGGRQPHILVVDAMPSARRRMDRELRRAGCTTVEAATPLETLRLLEWMQVPIDGVVIGPALTQTRARELASFLAQAYPGLRIATIRRSASRTRRAPRALRGPQSSHPPPKPTYASPSAVSWPGAPSRLNGSPAGDERPMNQA